MSNDDRGIFDQFAAGASGADELDDAWAARDFWAEADGSGRRRSGPSGQVPTRIVLATVACLLAVLLAWGVRTADRGGPDGSRPVPAPLVPTEATAPPADASPAPAATAPAAPAATVTTAPPATTTPAADPAPPVTTDAPEQEAAAASEAAAEAAPAASPLPVATAPAATARSEVQTTPARRTCTAGTYRVQRNDGWIRIAKRVGVTTKALLQANGATTRTALYPGRTICLPAGATWNGSSGAAPATTAPPAAAPSRAPATPPAPPPTTPPTTAVQVRTYTPAEVEAIIRQVWPDELEDKALQVAKRESTLRPTAKNWCCYGLFQIYFDVHKKWLAGMGVTSANQLFDPVVNATAAYALYQRAGSWQPWGG